MYFKKYYAINQHLHGNAVSKWKTKAKIGKESIQKSATASSSMALLVVPKKPQQLVIPQG